MYYTLIGMGLLYYTTLIYYTVRYPGYYTTRYSNIIYYTILYDTLLYCTYDTLLFSGPVGLSWPGPGLDQGAGTEVPPLTIHIYTHINI